MKQKLNFALLVMLLSAAFQANAVKFNSTNFPDANFRAALKAYDKNVFVDDREVTAAELAKIKKLNVSNKGIANLKGIQYFTALTTLRCGDNSITSDKFDISALTELDTLICSNNNLSSIDFSRNTKLKQLYCGSQKVTMSSIDVSMLEDLRFLSVIQTGLSSLDVSKNTKLTYLSCYRNPLTALDVSKNIELEELYVYRCAENGGGLTELDVRNNKN